MLKRSCRYDEQTPVVYARKRRFKVTLSTGVRSSKRRVRKAGEEVAKSLADILECTWRMKGWDK